MTKALLSLELKNLWGLNVVRHSRDPRVRRKALLMAVVWMLLIAMAVFYTGALSWGLVSLDLAPVIPAYLMAITSLCLFFFGLFRTGGTLFRRDGYDMLCALPVTSSAIVLSRLLRMYVQDLAVTAVLTLPGFCICAWGIRPGWTFWVMGIACLLVLPLIPLAATSLLGVLVSAAASRFRHKGLAEAALSIVIVLAVLFGSSQLSRMEGSFTPELLRSLADTITALLRRLYPPAVFLGGAMVENRPGTCLLWLGLSAALFAAVSVLVSIRFHAICRRLFSLHASHNYKLTAQQQRSVLGSLCRREFRRYFASGIYVSNTILGPILGAVLSGALLFSGTELLSEAIPLPLDIARLAPLLVAAIFCIMSTTAASISMEGRQWWIVKSLPLSAKSILDAKLLMNLLLDLPFFVLSQVFLTLALKPGLPALLWQIVLPALLILLSRIWGLTANLLFPVLDWESETAVVKQSAASLLGMAGFLPALLCIVLTALTPSAWSELLSAALCLLLLGAACLLYRRNCAADLKGI